MKQHITQTKKGLLRFTTAGSVDDGKSTLIGRLLYDSKSILEDQLQSITEISTRKGEKDIDLSLLTDGLKAEREQGITIDVAYRYFTTPKRKFIIADTPGHIQYTRNMVTGASTADLAVILVDARAGIKEQTNRHTYIAYLLGIKHVVFCINKMDLIAYEEDTYNKIKNDLSILAEKLNINNVFYIPISAKFGDNVVEISKNMKWYKGETFLECIENVKIFDDANFDDHRFPIQYVIRPQKDEYHDFRAYAGRIASGIFKQNQEVVVLPSNIQTKIKNIYQFNNILESAFPDESVSIELTDDIDISRGNMIVGKDNLPVMNQEIYAMICWFSNNPMQLKQRYLIRHTSNELKCIINELNYKIDINKIENNSNDKTLTMNEIASVSLKLSSPIFCDRYKINKITGSFILINETTNETIGAGMII